MFLLHFSCLNILILCFIILLHICECVLPKGQLYFSVALILPLHCILFANLIPIIRLNKVTIKIKYIQLELGSWTIIGCTGQTKN